MKKLQAMLEEVTEISQIPMILYDAEGTCAASCFHTNAANTFADTMSDLAGSILEFIRSNVDSQSLGMFHYFKVFSSGILSYVLLVLNYAPDSFTIGRLTVCQLRYLQESQEESITKASFVRSLVNGSLTASELNRQIKKLKLSAATWAAFVIECEDGFTDSYAYQLLEQAFAGHKRDLCCELDENHLLLMKDVSNISSSLKRFAQTLVDTLRAEALVQTHIGYSTTADSFAQLAGLYQEAFTALRIRHTFFAEQDTIAYDKLGLGRLIAELPKDLCSTFLYEVFGRNLPDDLDEETQHTIRIFYENNLNISETARQLYLHRNTLVYRLERLEKRLGLDIRKFEDAMTFKLAMMILAHVRNSC